MTERRALIGDIEIIGDTLEQRSQTRGPRTLGKMKISKEILGRLVYFLKNIGN